MNLTKQSNLVKRKLKKLQAKQFKETCKNYVRLFKIYENLKKDKQLKNKNLTRNIISFDGMINLVINELGECYKNGYIKAYELALNLEELQTELKKEFNEEYEKISVFLNSVVNIEGGQSEK